MNKTRHHRKNDLSINEFHRISDDSLVRGKLKSPIDHYPLLQLEKWELNDIEGSDGDLNSTNREQFDASCWISKMCILFQTKAGTYVF